MSWASLFLVVCLSEPTPHPTGCRGICPGLFCYLSRCAQATWGNSHDLVYWCDVIASGMCMGAVGIIGNGGRNRPIVDRNDDVMTRRTSLSSLFLLLLA